MRKWYYRGLVAVACLSLVGCAERVDTAKQAESLARLQAGRAVLGCHQPCLAEWQRNQPQAAQLDAGARWQELGLLVMRIGYQDDLSLYYLARAAEGLGYRGAAAGYYRQSTQVSGTPASCSNSAMRSVLSGVSSLGFITTVLPAASAGPSFQLVNISGKFQGTICPTTPIASRSR